jgi:hypothetical protein
VRLTDWSVQELAERCTDESRKFSRSQLNDPRFCFELLQRALLDKLPDALTEVYRVYQPQVMRWVYAHASFQQTDEEAEFFATGALRNFYFAVSGPKFEQFSSLPQLLSYMKLCVHTAIVQYLRDHQRLIQVPLNEIHEPGYLPDLGASLEAGDIWTHICDLLPDESDQLLANSVFAKGLKPKQILLSDPLRWSSEREISVALQRIRRILRKDAKLCQWAGELMP